MPSANHRKRFCAREKGGTWDLSDRFFACINKIGVFCSLQGIGPYAEHSVLALQNNFHTLRNIISHESRHANTKVDVETVLQLLGDAFHNECALIDIFCRLSCAVACHVSLLDYCPAFRTVLRSIRFSDPTDWNIRFT